MIHELLNGDLQKTFEEERSALGDKVAELENHLYNKKKYEN